MAELIAEDYRKHRNMNVITLRPRGFIPFWDRDAYTKYSEWARWFWKGVVHIDDVAAAVILSLDLVSRRQITQPLVPTLIAPMNTPMPISIIGMLRDRVRHSKNTTANITIWRFRSDSIRPALKPTKLDISDTVRWLGYKPSYSLASLLSELAVYGDSGPPHLIKA